MPAHGGTVVVRAAHADEVAAAGEIVASAYLHDLSVSEGYASHLRDAAGRAQQALLLVGVDERGTVLGSLTYARGGTSYAQLAKAGESELRMLGVRPQSRGRGVAEALVLAAIQQARADGSRRIVLSTQPEMLAAHRLYERLGFTRRPDLDWDPEPGVELLGYQLDLLRRPDPCGAARQ